MSTLEVCAVVVAASSIVIAAASVTGLASLRRLRRQLETMGAYTNRTLVRLNGIAANLDGIVRDGRRLETRVHAAMDVLLDEIEPPLRLVRAVLAGTRTGLAALTRSSANGIRMRGRSEPERMPQKGETHEHDTEQ